LIQIDPSSHHGSGKIPPQNERKRDPFSTSMNYGRVVSTRCFFFGGKGCVLLGDRKKIMEILKNGEPITYPTQGELRKIMDSKVQAGNMFQEGTNTVDGRNPAPVDMVNTPLFSGFYTSQWCRISSINSMVTIEPSFFSGCMLRL